MRGRTRGCRGCVVEDDFDLPIPDHDALNDGLHDPALLVIGESRPAAVQAPCLLDGFLFREVGDTQDVDLGLDFRDLVIELGPALGKGTVLLPEALFVDHPGLVEVIELVGLGFELPGFPFEEGEELLLFLDGLARLLKVGGNLCIGEQEALDLFMEDGFEVIKRHLVPALLAGVLRAVRRDIHPCPAGAERQPGEEVHDCLSRFLEALALAIEKDVALAPELFGDDGWRGKVYPLLFRLKRPGTFLAVRVLGVVGPTGTFSDRITDEAIDGGVGKLAAVSCPVALLVQETSNRFLALVLPEEFKHELAHGGFGWIKQELLPLPLVAIGGLTAGRLTCAGTDRDSGGDTLGNLFPLPLRHCGDHGVEEASGRRRCVD
jgi:hypothetical protein